MAYKLLLIFLSHPYFKFLEAMFLLGEDVLKNMKFAIKGTEITEEISNAEIERFNGLADGIYRSVCDDNTKIKRKI